MATNLVFIHPPAILRALCVAASHASRELDLWRARARDLLDALPAEPNVVKFRTEDDDVFYLVKRVVNLDWISITSQGVLISRRGNELLLIDTAGLMSKTEINSLGLSSNKITDIDLLNLRLTSRERGTVTILNSVPEEVFSALHEWASNSVLARLDSSDFKGSTWIGVGVFVLSAYSPRAEQEVRRYRNNLRAHHDRFGVISHFAKAINSLNKKMRHEIRPRLLMDKDLFYTEVA